MHAHQPLLMFILVTYAYLNFISYTKITLIGRHAMLLSYGDTSEHTVYGSERPWGTSQVGSSLPNQILYSHQLLPTSTGSFERRSVI